MRRSYLLGILDSSVTMEFSYELRQSRTIHVESGVCNKMDSHRIKKFSITKAIS